MSQTFNNIVIRLESPGDASSIEELGAATFGPGRFSRSAFRLREGVSPDPALSFVAECDGQLCGSVRLTPIRIGEHDALVLGPLMISTEYRSLGIGRELMNRSMIAAGQGGHRLVVLVGDHAYYKAFGFEQVPAGQITFPGPADPARILASQLEPGCLSEFHGVTQKAL